MLKDELKKRVRAYLDSHEFKVGFVRYHRKLAGVRKLFRALGSDDPWAVLGLIGVHNRTYIHHPPNPGRTVSVKLSADPRDVPQDVELRDGVPIGVDGPFVPGDMEATIVAVVTAPRIYPRTLVKPHLPSIGQAELTGLAQEYELGAAPGNTETTEEEREKLKGLWRETPDVSDIFFPKKREF